MKWYNWSAVFALLCLCVFFIVRATQNYRCDVLVNRVVQDVGVDPSIIVEGKWSPNGCVYRMVMPWSVPGDRGH